MCETKIKIAYIKKHEYKEKKKKKTHVEVGEEDIDHHIYIFIKDKHKVCKNGHKTGVKMVLIDTVFVEVSVEF